jgi:hypothetical protein
LYSRNLRAPERQSAEGAGRHPEFGDEAAVQMAFVDESQHRRGIRARATWRDQGNGLVQAAFAEIVAGREPVTLAEHAGELLRLADEAN